MKGRFNKGLPANLYFWRDLTGHEVDLIAEWGGVLKAIEIKASATFQRALIKNVTYFCTLSAQAKGYLIYMGSEGIYLNNILVPLHKIHQLL